MIFCKFCGDQNAKQFLYLTCQHLSCLTCAFLRAEFTTQEIQCCDQLTKIEQDSMEIIIKSKRFHKSGEDSTQKKNISQPPQGLPKAEIPQNKNQCKQKDQNHVAEVQEAADKKQSSQVKKVVTQYRKQILEEDEYELENILIRHLEKSKKYFQTQRQLLRQREEETVKSLIGIFEHQKRKLEMPITQSVLQKFNLMLQKKSNLLDKSTPKHVQTISQVYPAEEKAQKSPRESYDHILKKLELNQQRMKQKIQKHLQVLY